MHRSLCLPRLPCWQHACLRCGCDHRGDEVVHAAVAAEERDGQVGGRHLHCKAGSKRQAGGVSWANGGVIPTLAAPSPSLPTRPKHDIMHCYSQPLGLATRSHP